MFSKNKGLILLLIFAIATTSILLLFHKVTVLTIENYENGNVLFRKIVPEGYTFATVIRHSVHLSPVYEYYSIDKSGKMYLTSTKLQDLGWGVPSTYKNKGKFEKNFLVIEGINKPIDFLPFRVSYIAKPALLMDHCEKKVDLTKAVNDGERIDISTTKTYLWKFLTWGDVNVLF